MKKLKQLTAALLAAVMSMTALTACNKEKGPVLEKRTNVYAGTETELPEGIEYIQNTFGLSDGLGVLYSKTYTITYNENGEEVERTLGYDWREDLAEGWYQSYMDESWLAMLSSDGTINEMKLDLLNDESSNSYVRTVVSDPSGNIYALISSWLYNEDYTESTTTYELRSIDPTTGDAKTIPLDKAIVASGVEDINSVYVNSVAVSDSGEIYVNLENSIVAIDSNGEFKNKVEIEDQGWISGVYPSDGKLYILYYPSVGGQTLKIYDNGQITDYTTDNFKALASSIGSIYCIRDNKLYYGTSTGVSSYDMTTDTASEIMNYINSDFSSDNMSGVTVLSDERIAIVMSDYSGDKSKHTVSILERVPDDQLNEEIILELGCLYSDYYLTGSVIRFNKQNTGVRVTVRDYSQYNNEENEWKGAATQLNNDIITGNMPDIILLSSDLPVESYFQSELFADLNKYIDDPENGIDCSQYLENVIKASESNGRLNSMILSFSLYTLVAKEKFVGTESGWTFEDMMEAIRNMPEGMEAFLEYSRSEVLQNFFTYSMDSFVNWETGETYFNTPSFIEFMEFLSTCSETSFWKRMYPTDGQYEYNEELSKEYDEKYSLRFYNDYSMFYLTEMSRFRSIMNIRTQFASSDITFIGFPTNDENSNGATIVPQVELAISAQSLAKSEAWSFIKFVLNDKDYSESIWCFTPNLNRLEEQKAETKESYHYYEYTEDDLAWYKEYYSEEYYNYMKERNKPFDDATLEQMMELLRGTTRVQRDDSSLRDIVNEELSAFFAGTRSAEETAKIIDSRARIYVSEHS